MLYPYELVEIKSKPNKKKICLGILIVLIIVVLSIYSAIKLVEYKKQKEEQANLQQIQEEEKMEKEKLVAEEEKRLKNASPFTEEQILAIENIYSAEGEKRVFLTFDDGPTTSVTPHILDLLKQESIKATFFVLGNRVKANEALIQREFEEGHYIANHGYSHKYSQIYQNSQTVLEEYNLTEQYIQDALNNPDYHSKLFRFPGGSQGGYYNEIKGQAKQYLKENGIVSLDWNALSKDADGAKTKEDLLQNVIETVGQKQNVVLLMHDAADKILTYETLPDIIQYLRDNGYQFKTVYDIL